MWWKTEQEDGQIFLPTEEVEKMKVSPETRKSKQLINAYDRMSKMPDGSTVFEELETDFKTRDNMKRLTESRVDKLIVEEIEEELKALQKVQTKGSKPGKSDTFVSQDTLARRSENDLFGTKSRCKLQLSYVQIMLQVFKDTDKYNDGILRRTDYVEALRQDKTVQSFLEHEAIKLDRKTKLTVDEVLREFDKDQYLHAADDENDVPFDHKEFCTWDEFLEFFEDYRTPEERMRREEIAEKFIKIPRTQKEKDELKQQQIEEEKERRIRDLPRFREEDRIDVDQEYLDIVRNIFDTCDKVEDKWETVTALEFYMALKKDPEMIKINNVIAREPDGKSRIATETFKEVFYRMEDTHEEKYIDWPTVLEYFTKRGRPLTPDEIEELKLQDKNADEQYEHDLEEK